MKLDIDFVRAQFTQLGDDSESAFVFASNAGGSYVCNPVNEILEHYNRHTRVQPYSRYPSSTAGLLRPLNSSMPRLMPKRSISQSNIATGRTRTGQPA